MKPSFRLYGENKELYKDMLKDIKAAKDYIYLETYILGQDDIGNDFVNALTQKAKENVSIKLCVDGIGTSSRIKYFKKLIQEGGEVKIFYSFEWSFHIINNNHRRNHRKLLIIDDEIIYIGSANITSKSLDWNDITIKLRGDISHVFKKIFIENYLLANKIFFKKKDHIKPIHYKDWEIIRDVPSFRLRMFRKRLIHLLRNAKKEIILTTPYFVPDKILVNELKLTAKKGIKVTLILPAKSDVKVTDIIMQKYLGKLHQSGVLIRFYHTKTLHSKVILVDNHKFIIGSANLDHRSLSHQFEINLLGTDKKVKHALNKLIDTILKTSNDFDYEQWTKRGIWQKFLEKIISPFRIFL